MTHASREILYPAGSYPSRSPSRWRSSWPAHWLPLAGNSRYADNKPNGSAPTRRGWPNYEATLGGSGLLRKPPRRPNQWPLPSSPMGSAGPASRNANRAATGTSTRGTATTAGSSSPRRPGRAPAAWRTRRVPTSPPASSRSRWPRGRSFRFAAVVTVLPTPEGPKATCELIDTTKKGAAPAKGGSGRSPSPLVDFPSSVGETPADAHGEVILPEPSDVRVDLRRTTAKRLNVREPSRSPTDAGSRGKYDPAEQTALRSGGH